VGKWDKKSGKTGQNEWENGTERVGKWDKKSGKTGQSEWENGTERVGKWERMSGKMGQNDWENVTGKNGIMCRGGNMKHTYLQRKNLDETWDRKR